MTNQELISRLLCLWPLNKQVREQVIMLNRYSCFSYFNYLRNNFAEPGMLNDTTIEERVTVLEFQVGEIANDITQINDDMSAVNSDVTILTDDVSTLENDVRDLDEDLESQLTVISAEQVLQDDRIFTLEQNEEGFFS